MLQAERFGIAAEEMEHVLEWSAEDDTSSCLRMHLRKETGRSGARVLDLHEFYWAGLVQGRISLRQVLVWLARTSLVPLLWWSKQPAILFREKNEKKETKRRVGIFLRELGRAALLAVFGLGLTLSMVYAIANWREIGRTAEQLWVAITPISHPFALVCWITTVVFALMILRGGIALLVQRFRPTIEPSISRLWIVGSFATAVALGVAAWSIDWRWDIEVVRLAGALWTAVRSAPVAVPLVAALVGLVLSRILVKYLGDIALYVTADERSEFFRTRSEILEGSTKQLRSLLADPQYEAVYVAGHSLGSVIAYDTINRIVREVRAASTDAAKLDEKKFNKLLGLLTFGCPLDKIYYFFRTEVGERQAVRAQLLSSLHSFRKMASERDYGCHKLKQYDVPEPPKFRWLNVYSPPDVVSAHLDFYEVEEQPKIRYRNPFAYLNPVGAHLAYWRDSDFYRNVAKWL